MKKKKARQSYTANQNPTNLNIGNYSYLHDVTIKNAVNANKTENILTLRLGIYYNILVYRTKYIQQ